MINWKNTAENLALVLVGVIFGVIIGHKVTKVTSNDLISNLKPTLDKAIDKETIKNEIKNEINVDKIKKSDSLKIILEPNNNQKPKNTIQIKNNCDEIWNKLSTSRKKRLKRWIEN